MSYSEVDKPTISDYIEAMDIDSLESAVESGVDVKWAIFDLLAKFEEDYIESGETIDVNSYLEILEILLTKADPNETNIEGDTPLLYIAGSTHANEMDDVIKPFVTLLIKKGANINVQTPGPEHIPLISIAITYDLPMTDILLKNKVDVNATDKLGATALHYLAENSSDAFTMKRLESILSLGSVDKPLHKVLNAQTLSGETPMLAAVKGGHLDIAMALLDMGASPEIRDNSGKAIKDYIVPEEHPEEYAALVTDAEVSALARKALENDNMPEFRKQVDKLTNVNFQSVTGDTLLHYAVDMPNVEAVAFLLVKKADPTITNYSGKIPIMLITGTDPKSLEMKTMLEEVLKEEAPPPGPVERPVENSDTKYIVNAALYPGFEIRPFRGEENNVVPVYITTLPKGMLLFRGVSNVSKISEDLLGIRKADGYCMPPQYNVFAYPFPFVDETVGTFSSIVVYKLLRDVKVACFVSPCPLSRADRNIKNMPTTSCDLIPNYGCGIKGRHYDPCLNEKFAKENPDIIGMIAIAGTDRAAFMDKLEADAEFRTYLNRYFSGYMDSHSLYPGIPEIILYPRTTRNATDVTTSFASVTSYSEAIKLVRDKEDTVYIPEHIIPVRSRDALRLYLDINTKNGNIKIDKSTGFFVVAKHFSPPGLLEDPNKMAESFTELRFTRAKFPWLFTDDDLGSTTSERGGRRVTHRKRLQ